MKAMIFAAGLGTRLKPFTDHHPKALAEVCGHPMLEIVIGRLKQFGVGEIVVNVHHFADQIEEFIHRNHNFGIDIHISDERSGLLDTGGGILAARHWLDGDDPFIVHNADILTDFNLDEMVDIANSAQAAATLLVADRQTKRYLLFDQSNMLMKGWTNIETGEIRPASLSNIDGLSRYAFGGIHIISPEIFPALSDYAATLPTIDGQAVPKFSIMDFYIDACSRLSVLGFTPSTPYRWHDIGKPTSLADAERDFKSFI